MDKSSPACYTQGMEFPRSSVLLMLPLCCSSVLAQGGNSLNKWDVESMYVQARAMLEDRSIQDVSSVPMLLETSAREGHTEAARLLLDVYEGKFKGLNAKPEHALRLTRRLAEEEKLDKMQGGGELRTEAMYRLALFLEKGVGCSPEKTEAYKWIQQASGRGKAGAKVEEARFLMNGIGTSPNPKRAWKLLYKQAKKNPHTPHVFFYMGHMCDRGIGMRRDARKAFELYRLGGILNDAQCLNNLGTMFEKGHPTPQDYEIAYRLYRKAAELGNKEASANMQRLAFKEGIRASNRSQTPYRTRIDNATQHIIRALPVAPETQERLISWLMLSPANEET